VPANLLFTIAEKRRARVAERRGQRPAGLPPRPADLPPPRAGAFRAALRRATPDVPLHLLGELKKASPSKGVLRADFDVPALAAAYARGGATALSVLTEPDWFQGAPEFLTQAKRASGGLPCLMKDFIVDPWQLDEAVSLGADAVLLITALLPLDGLAALLGQARARGLDALVEVHTEAELELALGAEADLVGINARDLATFEVDPRLVLVLRPRVPAGVVVVAESGIASPDDIRALADAGVDAALVGEAVMRRPDVAAAVAEFAAAALPR
jgi:indole-3-glycerol phosphate synthase